MFAKYHLESVVRQDCSDSVWVSLLRFGDLDGLTDFLRSRTPHECFCALTRVNVGKGLFQNEKCFAGVSNEDVFKHVIGYYARDVVEIIDSLNLSASDRKTLISLYNGRILMTDGDYALLKKAAAQQLNDTDGQPCARVEEIIQQSFSSRITQSLVGVCTSIEHVELFESLGFCPQVCVLLQQRRALIERDELKKKWFSLIDQGDLEGVKSIIEDNRATKLEVLSWKSDRLQYGMSLCHALSQRQPNLELIRYLDSQGAPWVMTSPDQSSYVMAHRYGSIDLVRYAGQRTAMMVDKKLSSYYFFQQRLNDEMSQDYLSAALKVAIEYNNIDLLNDLLDANESPLGLKVQNDATSDFFRPQNKDRFIMTAIDNGSFDVFKRLYGDQYSEDFRFTGIGMYRDRSLVFYIVNNLSYVPRKFDFLDHILCTELKSLAQPEEPLHLPSSVLFDFLDSSKHSNHMISVVKEVPINIRRMILLKDMTVAEFRSRLVSYPLAAMYLKDCISVTDDGGVLVRAGAMHLALIACLSSRSELHQAMLADEQHPYDTKKSFARNVEGEHSFAKTLIDRYQQSECLLRAFLVHDLTVDVSSSPSQGAQCLSQAR